MSNQAASASGQGDTVKRGRGRPPKSSYSNNVSPEMSMPSLQQQSMPSTLGVDPRIAAAMMASSGQGHMVTHPGQQQFYQMQGMYPIPPSMVQSMVTRGQRGQSVAPTVQETDSSAPSSSFRGRGRPRNSERKKQADAEKSKNSDDDDDEYTPSFSSRPPRWTDNEVRYYVCLA